MTRYSNGQPLGVGGGYADPSDAGDYLRGDRTWQDLNKAAVGLSNVDNTSDANKPISSATQSALDAKVTGAGGNASATVVTAAGGSASRTLADRFADVINIKDRGAVGDGATDNYAIFAAADALGAGLIVIPEGDYYISTNFAMQTPVLSLNATVTPASGNWLPRLQYGIADGVYKTNRTNRTAEYSATPVSYTILSDRTVHYAYVINQIGYQSSYDTDIGVGRTMVPVWYADCQHSGYGDLNVFHGAVAVSRHANYTLATKWTGRNSATISSGAVNAATSHANLYAMEFHLQDQAQADVAAYGLVIDMKRTGSKTVSYSTPWVGVRVQGTDGATVKDVAYQLGGTWKVGLDFSGATLDANKTALALKGGDRVYWNVGATDTASDQWFAGDGGTSLGTVYTHYSSSALTDVVGGTSILSRYSDRVEVRPGADGAFAFRVYGASASALIAMGMSGTTAYIQGASTGADNVALAFRTAASGTETDTLVLKSSKIVNIPTLPPTYADNAAATAGGLVAGDIYRTASGQLMIRY